MKKTFLQKLAFVYFILFFLVVSLNYIPAIHDEHGLMFGLFKLDPIDDILHGATALWALTAGFYSVGAAQIYFRTFGIFYFLDGLICTLFGQCLLDFTLFTQAHDIGFLSASNFIERMLLNGPHLILGGAAIYFGFVLSKKFSK